MEYPSDIRDEENIPQQSAISDQSNWEDNDREAPLTEVATNTSDGENLVQSTSICIQHLHLHKFIKYTAPEWRCTQTKNINPTSAFFLIFGSSKLQAIWRQTNKQCKRKNCRELDLKELQAFVWSMYIMSLLFSIITRQKWSWLCWWVSWNL